MLYMAAKDVLLDTPGLDVRKLRTDGFVSMDKVIVWYAEDDLDCPPSHGKWLADHFQAHTRSMRGEGGHEGAAMVVDHEQFIGELVGACDDGGDNESAAEAVDSPLL
jgi:hypothetical protein